MARLTDEEKTRNEAAIRAAIDRLLRGEIPRGSRCDIKTLAAEAGVARTGFYPKGARPGPYQHLAAEFERRLAALRDATEIPDPREAQITRLKVQAEAQRARIAALEAQLAELTAFKTLAISRLAAQYDEILRLRQSESPGNVTPLRHR
jgi:hypothetical protein